jgi:ubiquitin-protein ligase
VAFDTWPLLDEYPPECLHETHLFHEDGSTARVYSCYCQPVVDLHTKWLADYNLDGFMLQRFVSEIQTPNPASTQRNQVAQYVRQACEKYNRVFSIMYDISGANPDLLFDVYFIYS